MCFPHYLICLNSFRKQFLNIMPGQHYLYYCIYITLFIQYLKFRACFDIIKLLL